MTTLHRDLFNKCKGVGIKTSFSRAILTQEYQNKIQQDFFRCIVVFSFKDNITRGFNLCKFVSGVLRHYCKRFFPVQSPNTSEATLHKKITCAMSTQSAQALFCR